MWALVLGALLAAVIGWLSAERRAVLSMAPAPRAALFQKSWEGFERLCQADRSDAFADRCREQARFLLLFPECDGACQARARLHTGAFR